MASTKEVLGVITRSVKNEQNISDKGFLRQIMESGGLSASIDVIRNEIRSQREDLIPFGDSLNFVTLQQQLYFKTRGYSYIMDDIEKTPRDACKNINEQVFFVNLLSILSLQDKSVDSPSCGCDGMFIFVFKFFEDPQLELFSLVTKDVISGEFLQ